MIVVIKDLYTLKSWEDQDTESLAFHLNNKKIWDNWITLSLYKRECPLLHQTSAGENRYIGFLYYGWWRGYW